MEMNSLSVELPIYPLGQHFDGYGHLNNAYYPVYFEEGRYTLARKLGFEPDSMIKDGKGFIVTDARYRYIQPVRRFHRERGLIILTQLEKEDFHLVMRQQLVDITRRNTFATARILYCFTKIESGKPTKIPKKALDLFAFS